MILYCDFNPRLTREYTVNNLENYKVNVASSSRNYISGSGIDAMEFTENMGGKVSMIGFYGGENGNYIREKLKNKFSFRNHEIRLIDESVEEIVLKSIGARTSVRTKTPRIILENIREFYAVFERELESVDFVVLTESDNLRLKSNLYEELIKSCYKKGIKVAVAMDDIQDIGEAKPYIMAINKDNLENYLEGKINSEEDYIVAGEEIISRGTAIVIIYSMDGAYVFTKGENIKVEFSEIRYDISELNHNLLLAGIAVGFERKYDMIMSIKFGIAAAIAENFMKFRNITMADLKKLINYVEIKKVDN